MEIIPYEKLNPKERKWADLADSLGKRGVQNTTNKRIPGRDFYIPSSGREVKNWLKDYYRKNNLTPKKAISGLRRNEAYALYFSIMEKP